jgi:hypothetical protein
MSVLMDESASPVRPSAVDGIRPPIREAEKISWSA